LDLAFPVFCIAGVIHAAEFFIGDCNPGL
jgi:hypothetical protein